jgi:hypothetical protein
MKMYMKKFLVAVLLFNGAAVFGAASSGGSFERDIEKIMVLASQGNSQKYVPYIFVVEDLYNRHRYELAASVSQAVPNEVQTESGHRLSDLLHKAVKREKIFDEYGSAKVVSPVSVASPSAPVGEQAVSGKNIADALGKAIKIIEFNQMTPDARIVQARELALQNNVEDAQKVISQMLIGNNEYINSQISPPWNKRTHAPLRAFLVKALNGQVMFGPEPASWVWK